MSPAEALNTQPVNGKRAILVVDDERGIREFLSAYLSTKDFKVFSADSADSATVIWKEHKDQIALIVTDVLMPGVPGTTLAQRLLVEKPQLKIIFMSGYLPEEIAHETLDFRFFRKPFHPGELLGAIREALH